MPSHNVLKLLRRANAYDAFDELATGDCREIKEITGQHSRLIQGVSAVAFGPGGELAAATSDGNIRIWTNRSDLSALNELKNPLGPRIQSLAFSGGDGKFLGGR